MTDAFVAAAAAARENPELETHWDTLEDLAASAQLPDEVGEVYREVLDSNLAPNVAGILGRRAVQFHEEWFREDSPKLVQVLKRVLQIDPTSSQWAFQRLTVVYTVAERWDELLALYDAEIKSEVNDSRRAQLLEEAAQTAKDFAGKPDRAIDYLQDLLPLRLTDRQLASSLERLLERRERWSDLIKFWRDRLDTLSMDEARETRMRIAKLWMEKLNNYGEALVELREVVNNHDADASDACAMLEVIVADEAAEEDARRDALALLRGHYAENDRTSEIVKTLDYALRFAEDSERVSLHRDAAERLVARSEIDGAMEQLGEALKLAPTDPTLRARLRALADESGGHEQLVAVYQAAAEATTDLAARCEVLTLSGDLCRNVLGEPDSAVRFYERVLGEASTSTPLRPMALASARNLASLHGDAERHAEQLAMLERLAELEPSAGDRRDVLGEAARLARQLGEADRAVAAWEARLSVDEHDAVALDSLIEVLDEAERSEELIAALRRRAGLRSSAQRRADLERVASVYSERAQFEEAIATWREVTEEFGEDVGAVDQLTSLYAQQGRGDELIAMLERATGREDSHIAQVRCILGDASRGIDPGRAVGEYQRALEAVPDHVGARAGLAELCEVPTVRRDAVEALAASYRRMQETEPLLALLEQRVDATQVPAQKVQLLVDAAKMQEEVAPASAITSVGRALVYSPKDSSLEAELSRLAEATGALEGAATWFGAAGDACDDARREAELRAREGDLRERAEQPVEALTAFSRALSLAPFSEAYGEAVSRLSDADRGIAEQALISASQSPGAPSSHLARLASVQRHAPGRALYDTLHALADLDETNVDPLKEAADLALALNDQELASTTFEKMYARAARMVRRDVKATGEVDPREAAAWCADELANAQEEVAPARAVEVLADAARLPLNADIISGLRLRGAKLAFAAGAKKRAADLFRDVLEVSAEPEAFDALASLYKDDDRVAELLGLRQRELAEVTDPNRRLELRLSIASLVGEIQKRGGQLEALRANLAEQPGHEGSVSVLVDVLSRQRRHDELAKILAEQAKQVDGERAASLWSRVAGLAEEHLNDAELALEAHRRVVDVEPRPTALDALARLHTERNEHGPASRWLERRLSLATDEEHANVSIALGRSLIAAGRVERACEVLDYARGRALGRADIRDLLADQYRATEKFAPLAKLLTESAEHETDQDKVLALVREAATLYNEKLDSPAAAIPVLRKGIALAPDDRAIKLQLAEGLFEANELDESRSLLESVVADFGRRRSPERASVHYELGRVARAQGDVEGALEEVELATKMVMQDPRMLRMLGQLAQEAGQYDRAEKAYRALLMIVRRQSDGELEVGSGEVLFELHALAKLREDEAQAAELLDSALEAAAQSDEEASRFQLALSTRGRPDLALEGLERRLRAAADPASHAKTLAAIGDVLESSGQKEQAFTRRLEALDHDPSLSSVHEQTQALAEEIGKTDEYLTALDGFVERSRRQEDKPLQSSILLRLGRVREARGEIDSSANLYRRAEELADNPADAWAAIARVAAVQEDAAEQRRVLAKLVDTDGLVEAQRTDALYQLAEVQLVEPRQFDAGAVSARRAFDADPRPDVIGRVLGRAAAMDPNHDEVMRLFEEVARSAGEEPLVLDFLERRAARRDVTLPQLREAVDRSRAAEQLDRVDSYLARAVQVAEESEAGVASARWALLGLAQRSTQGGDAAKAMHWMQAALDVTHDEDERRGLELEFAGMAAQAGGDARVAEQIYERLLADTPSDRAVWEPLLAVYGRLGEEDKMRALVTNVVDGLLDPGDRNAARMAAARFYMSNDEREFEAVDVLKAVLAEQPDHSEAAELLTVLYKKSGYDEDLVDLLERQIDLAKDNEDLEQIAAQSLQLGELLSKVRREDAMDVYRRALEWVPTNRDIIQSFLALFTGEDDPQEHASLRERLLQTETGADASALALSLYDEWHRLEDGAGMRRALEYGYAGDPSSDEVRSRLEAWYRGQEDWASLTTFLESEAQRLQDSDTPVALTRLLEAAGLRRDRLGDAGGAVQVLRHAATLSSDLSVLSELVRSLEAAGEHAAAIEEVSGAIERHDNLDDTGVSLLVMRARLRIAVSQVEEAVDDLELAYPVAPVTVAPDLVDALVQLQSIAAQLGDFEVQRATALRLVTVLNEAGEGGQAREVLAQWIEASPTDAHALEMLREIDTAGQNWPGVVFACSQLVTVQQGEEQVATALALVDAAAQGGNPADARTGLEYVHDTQPGATVIKEQLRSLYEAIGAQRELAHLLRSDAGVAETDEERFELLRNAGDILVQLQHWDESIEPLETAAALNPNDHRTAILLADAYTGAGRYADVGQMLETAIQAHTKRRSPELSELQHRMAKLARAAGEQEIELQWLTAALEADKNNGFAASELAHLAMQLGDLDTALNALRAVTLSKVDGPMSRASAFLFQAKIAHERGEARRAVLWARKARSEDPELQEATEFLNQLGEK